MLRISSASVKILQHSCRKNHKFGEDIEYCKDSIRIKDIEASK